jgi:SAM-dependent methyltransferase
LLAAKRNEAALFHRGIVGRLLNMLLPMPPGVTHWVGEQIGLRRLRKGSWYLKSRILDVGCGNGAALSSLSQLGFEDLWGIDQYIPNDITYSTRIRVLKKSIHELDQKFDIVTFHHSFEHMADPLDVLRSVHRVLSDEGLCLIRIPVATSYAWEHYGVHWVQVDAPRHLFLHSVKSMEILAAQAGLDVAEIVWDSTEFQFWGSEQYVRDIPLMDDASYLNQPAKSVFSAQEIQNFRTQATELNTLRRGDQAAFFLSKKLSG